MREQVQSNTRPFLGLFIGIILIQQIYVPLIAGELKKDCQNTWRVTKNLGRALYEPPPEDLKIFFISSAIVFSSYFLDEPVRDFVQNRKTRFLDGLFSIDQIYGTRRVMFGGPALLYVGGWLSGSAEIRETGLQTLQAVFFAGTITSIIKEFSGRSRPYNQEGPATFKPFAFDERYRSFFSGHASITFAASTVLAHKIDHPAWKIFWYSAAILTAGARVYNDRHWFSDVLAGALVGYAVGNFINHQSDRGKADNIELTSTGYDQQVRCLFRYSFPF